MADAVALVEYVCPKCAAVTKLDPRFVRWCLSCGYGADPYPPEYTKRQARRRDRGIEQSLELFETLKTAKNLRPSGGLSRAITAYSLIVHLVGLLVLVAPILWWASGGPGIPAGIATVLGVTAFLAVRPRIATKKLKPDWGFDRSAAPQFYALLDRCAAQLGGRAPERVAISTRFNASTGRAGLAQRSFLIIGAPMWSILSGPERIALLGCELGHQVNGDTTHNLLAVSAERSLTEWTKLLNPEQSAGERAATRRITRRRVGLGSPSTAGLAALFVPLVMAVCFAPFFFIMLGCRAALTRLELRCGQRAEYLADELGARLAGTEAALSMRCKCAFRESLAVFVGARRRTKTDLSTLWPDFRAYVDSIPESEFQRRMVMDRLRNTRTDRSHPADHLRLALLHERAAQPGVLTVSDEEWAAIDAELAPRMLAAARAALR